jgi:hypothetical protein
MLFGGKWQRIRLGPSDVPSRVGVVRGDSLNLVPPSSTSSSSKSSSIPSSTTTTLSQSEDSTTSAAMVEDYLKQAGVAPGPLKDLIKGMGGGTGSDSRHGELALPSLQESMGMMNSMHG